MKQLHKLFCCAFHEDRRAQCFTDFEKDCKIEAYALADSPGGPGLLQVLHAQEYRCLSNVAFGIYL